MISIYIMYNFSSCSRFQCGVTNQCSGRSGQRYWLGMCLTSICDLGFRIFVGRTGMFLYNPEGGASCLCLRPRSLAISSRYFCPERPEHCLVTPVPVTPATNLIPSLRKGFQLQFTYQSALYLVPLIYSR